MVVCIARALLFIFTAKLNTWEALPAFLVVGYELIIRAPVCFFAGNAFRLFCLCLSLVGMVHGLSGLEGGIIEVVDMLFYHFMKAFVYIALVLETF